jgi:hypothetical protein
MDRRHFLRMGIGTALGGGVLSAWPGRGEDCDGTPPAYSVIPVVGDGRWIWNKPPEGQTGYLEPRPFRLRVGIELEGLGNATSVAATTPVPVACPEQKIDEERVEPLGCQAQVRELTPSARELVLQTPQIIKGQKVAAYAHYKLTLFKQYLGFQRDQFPADQKVPGDVGKQYLGNSPGIETRSREVRDLVEQLTKELVHPWDKARAFAEWIPKHIRPKMGTYLGVVRCLEMKLGDCEEMSALMVALCRAAEIPARLVWVPNHNWTEFHLVDNEGKGHWIPAHTACYFWWGWTGAHELVLQKGDRIWVPERRKHYRLQEDWLQWQGRKPRARYVAELTPEAAGAGSDPGPGARRKIDTGEWQLLGNHPLDKIARR